MPLLFIIIFKMELWNGMPCMLDYQHPPTNGLPLIGIIMSHQVNVPLCHRRRRRPTATTKQKQRHHQPNQHAPTSLKEKIDERYFAKCPGDHYHAADRKTNQKGDLRHTCGHNSTSE
jgi:hypothetical protein